MSGKNTYYERIIDDDYIDNEEDSLLTDKIQDNVHDDFTYLEFRYRRSRAYTTMSTHFKISNEKFSIKNPSVFLIDVPIQNIFYVKAKLTVFPMKWILLFLIIGLLGSGSLSLIYNLLLGISLILNLLTLFDHCIIIQMKDGKKVKIMSNTKDSKQKLGIILAKYNIPIEGGWNIPQNINEIAFPESDIPFNPNHNPSTIFNKRF